MSLIQSIVVLFLCYYQVRGTGLDRTDTPAPHVSGSADSSRRTLGSAEPGSLVARLANLKRHVAPPEVWSRQAAEHDDRPVMPRGRMARVNLTLSQVAQFARPVEEEGQLKLRLDPIQGKIHNKD
jgi:hypothetical protein